MFTQRRVPRTSRCCCAGGSESQRSRNRPRSFRSSLLTAFLPTGAGGEPGAASSARTRPARAKCRPAATRAANAARRPLLNRDSLTLAFLRGRLLLARDLVQIGIGEEIREVAFGGVFVHLVDSAQEFQQVLVGF